MINQKQIQLFLLLAVLAFASCQSHKETESVGEKKSQRKIQRFIPEEYRYPLNKIGNGKTFVYKTMGTLNDSLFYDVQLTTEAGTKYLLVTLYTSRIKLDSFKLTTEDNPIEIFKFRSPDLSDTSRQCIQGEIKEDTVIDNGTKLGKLFYNVAYAGKTDKLTINTEGEYLKDTILPWQGKQISCIVIKTKDKREIGPKLIPLLSREIGRNSGELFYAKGIGRLQFTWQNKEKLTQWQLVDIRDLK
jgi:hypothetical protein